MIYDLLVPWIDPYNRHFLLQRIYIFIANIYAFVTIVNVYKSKSKTLLA
jgi:hypothetical protein